MLAVKNTIGVRTIEIDEADILALWASHLRPLWGDGVLEELQLAEYRVGACLPESPIPIGFASITPYGDADGQDRGALWLEHLFIEPEHRGKGVQEPLYDLQIAYVREHPHRPVLRIPLHEKVVEFSTKRGWRKQRDLPGTPYRFGVYELPRERV